MISDSERREIAAILRGLDERIDGVPLMCTEQEHDAMVLSAIRAVIGNGDIFHRLADLIDRPTATATMDYEAMEDGIPDCRIWTCNGCKESFPVYRGFCPTYCPVCGMEIEK